MKTERRTLKDWEAAECAALKAEIAAHNQRVSKDKRLTQEEIADQLGMSQGTLSSHLNGKRALNLGMASKAAKMLGVTVEKFSPRLAKEIELIRSVPVLNGTAARNYRIRESGGVDDLMREVVEKTVERARYLAMREPFVGPNRAAAMINAEVQEAIAELVAELMAAAQSGDITDEQINAIRALIGVKKRTSAG